MYGTVARLKVKDGHWDDLNAINAEWEGQDVAGAIGTVVYRLDGDPNTGILCVLFASKKEYFANANQPDTDKWYQRFREHLDADPEWMDGEIVYANVNKTLP